MPATRAKMSSRGRTLFPMAALAPDLSTVDRTLRVVWGPRKSRPAHRTELIGPEARIAGPTRTKTSAKSGHWRAGIAYGYHHIFPAHRHFSTVRCTRLKIVVSPVRVRVSPSSFSLLMGDFGLRQSRTTALAFGPVTRISGLNDGPVAMDSVARRSRRPRG
jgi:hypothetical protein